MSNINDITINISSGALGLQAQQFTPLILVSGAVSSGVIVATEASDLTAWNGGGFETTDDAYKMAAAMFAQSPSPATVKVKQKADAQAYDAALAELVLTDNDWYGICIDSRDKANLALAGTWANSNKKFFFGCSEEIAALDNRNVTREAYLIHNNAASDFPECAWVGRELSRQPGSNTWKWKTLSGQNASTFTATELTIIRDRDGNALQEQAGAIFTNEGFATSGEYIDITIGQDWVENQITIELLSMFLANPKIPMDDIGIAQVESVVRGVLKRAGDNKIVARAVSAADMEKSDDKIYIFTVTVPARSDLSTNDRATRNLTGVKFEYTTAGAIHKVRVTGLIAV
jgi:hypothetical protein